MARLWLWSNRCILVNLFNEIKAALIGSAHTVFLQFPLMASLNLMSHAIKCFNVSQDGRIERGRDNLHCQHNANSQCVHCIPLDPFDESYLKVYLDWLIYCLTNWLIDCIVWFCSCRFWVNFRLFIFFCSKLESHLQGGQNVRIVWIFIL